MKVSLPGTVMVAAVAVAAGSPAVRQQVRQPRGAPSAFSDLLVDYSSMMLYVFSKDQPGKSVHNGGGAANRPPLEASKDATAAGNFSPITRQDDYRQWADMGRPLYTWGKDHRPGNMTGDGFLAGGWHVA